MHAGTEDDTSGIYSGRFDGSYQGMVHGDGEHITSLALDRSSKCNTIFLLILLAHMFFLDIYGLSYNYVHIL